MARDIDICIVGGCGHVGLPLGLAFADKNKKVSLYDIDTKTIDKVNAGKMPFKEEGAIPILKKALKTKKLHATNDIRVIGRSATVIIVVGTPIDEHLNPRINDIIKVMKEIEEQLTGEQLLVLRSTVHPGVTEKIGQYLKQRNKKTLVSFCPERIAEGNALVELYELPQIVSGYTEKAAEQAANLFKVIAKKVITVQPKEAELAKLFTNTWRYINFAISNQFYMIAGTHDLDFYAIHSAMVEDYPRLKSFAKAGFAAGPCLFKDTMQLSAFSNHNFFLGHSAMLVNEGLPDFIIAHMKKKYFLAHQTVGILGMAFKGNSDDSRESLAYKLKKKLEIEARHVLCHDPYIKHPDFVDMDTIRKEADIVVLAAPHSVYKSEDWSDRPVIDVWNFYEKGGNI